MGAAPRLRHCPPSRCCSSASSSAARSARDRAAPALFDHRNRAKSLPLCICAMLPWMHATVESIPSVKYQDTMKPESPRPDLSSTPSDSSRPSRTTTPDDATSTPTTCTSTPPRPERSTTMTVDMYHYTAPKHQDHPGYCQVPLRFRNAMSTTTTSRTLVPSSLTTTCVQLPPP